MKHLPLYTDTRAAIERVTPFASTDKSCTRCKLHDDVRSVCIGADGVQGEHGFEGAVLVLGDFPTQDEDDAARPVSAGPNSQLRDVVEKLTDDPIVYATALRCAPKGRTTPASVMKACAPYTAGLIEELKPSRILCFGKRAYQMVLGSTCDSIQLGRRGYGYLSDGTPVFMLHAARRVTPNRFLFRRWRNDIEWALTSKPALPPWEGEILEVETLEDAEAAAAALRDAGAFTYDTETGGLMGDDYFQVVCLTATPVDNLSVSYLWGEEALKDERREPLREVLRDHQVEKVGHNLKFDFEAVGYGLDLLDDRGVLEVNGVRGDTMLWVKTLDTECKGGLAIVDHHVGMGGHKAENERAIDAACELIGRCRSDSRQMRLQPFTHPALKAAVNHPNVGPKAFAYALVPREILYRYCALDTVATARLHAMYEPIVNKAPHFKLVSDELHRPPTYAVAQVETWGMSADIAAARAFGRLLTPRRDDALAKIRALGCDIDITSPQQLSQYLYQDLGLPVQELTKKGQQPSTSASSLEKLKSHHEVVPLLLEHAKVNKLLSTYVTGLIPHIRGDGRIRSSLNIAGARSGRMSSSNPNLQNIPSGGEYAKMAKAIFNAPPGHVLLQLDYSQLEVRIAAMLSQDPGLMQAYLDGADVHRRTASKAFGMPEDQVDKASRRNAKTVVFGVLYGKSAGSLSRDLGVPYDRGQFIYDSVLGVYATLTQWMHDQRAYGRKHGTTWTRIPMPDGTMPRARCRQLWHIAEPDSAQQSRANNAFVNTPVQGTASDFMLRTLVAVVNWIISDGIPARVTNTVHDSIILEVPFDWALEVAGVVKGIMEEWPSCGVPLVADVDVGMTWGALHKLEGLTLVSNARRNGLTDDEVIHLAQADSDLADEMGDDPAGWLRRVTDLGLKINA